jgi:putative isomerase
LITLHTDPAGPGHVRHVLSRGHDEIEVRPGSRYEVASDGVRVHAYAGRPPGADRSPREALRQCVYGNTVRAPDGTRYIPVNRAWVTMFGRMFGQSPGFSGPLVFIWDAAFNSIIAAEVDVDLALSNLRLLFEQVDPNGWFRQLRVGELGNNLTGLPVASLAVRALYERTGAVELIAEFFAPLVRANRWLRRHRDQNGDGLLEWGYEGAGLGIEVPGRYAPGYESGLDDSPMWEDEPVDEERRCLESSAVCLNALHAHDCLVLMGMARLLGREDEETELGAAYERARRLVNQHLWDDARGLYANRRWNGAFAAEISPTSLFPLLAEIPDRERAARLVEHLTCARTFGGEWRIPSIARSSPRFAASGDYWRGRIWPPLNYLVLLGLRKHDEQAAARLAEDSRRLFFQEWLAHGHIHENYCADTGWGEAPAGTYYRSCPFYTWGGLLMLP